MNSFYEIDPVMLILGLGGLLYSGIRKDYFPLLWSIPVFIFLQVIGFISSFHLLLLVTPLCIAGGNMMGNIVNRIKLKRHEKIVQWAVISILPLFGLVSTIILITINVSSHQFETAAFVSTYLDSHGRENIGLVASTVYACYSIMFIKRITFFSFTMIPFMILVKLTKFL